MDLSIIIVSFNTKEYTKKCVESVLKQTKDLRYEVVVVDNGSTDGSVEVLSNLATRNKEIKLVKNSENLGFAKANNIGIRKAKGRYILFLNSDTLIESNLLKEMVEWMKDHPKVGISTCALRNKDRTLQGTGGYFPTLLRVFSWLTIQDLLFVDGFIKPFHPMKEKSFWKAENFYKKEKELDWITGAFMLVNPGVVKAGVKWSEDYFMYTEDVDFCYKAKKAGWKVYYLPKWSIIHLGGGSSSTGYSILKEYEGIKIFYKKHYPDWQYPILRMLLKIGALGRVLLFAILNDRERSKIYVKAFAKA